MGGLIYGGAAWVEYIILDGPRYPIWMGTAAATWKINKINRAMLGMDYEFNKSVFEWGFHAVTFPERNQAKLAATRLAIFGGDEFLFGSFGVQLQVGFYTGNRRINQYVLTDYYSKLVMRGYFPKIRGTSIRPHLGVYLKAHKVIAEYISINGGFEF